MYLLKIRNCEITDPGELEVFILIPLPSTGTRELISVESIEIMSNSGVDCEKILITNLVLCAI